MTKPVVFLAKLDSKFRFQREKEKNQIGVKNWPYFVIELELRACTTIIPIQNVLKVFWRFYAKLRSRRNVDGLS